MIGTRLDQYEIVARLGEGRINKVFRARDTKLNRNVAIKVLPAAMQNDPERTARFRREAQMLASLNHPNIAQIYDTGAGYLTIKLVPNPTLADLIARGPIAPDEALDIACQVAQNVEAAHKAEIIH